jgi:hypothetical protein
MLAAQPLALMYSTYDVCTAHHRPPQHNFACIHTNDTHCDEVAVTNTAINISQRVSRSSKCDLRMSEEHNKYSFGNSQPPNTSVGLTKQVGARGTRHVVIVIGTGHEAGCFCQSLELLTNKIY